MSLRGVISPQVPINLRKDCGNQKDEIQNDKTLTFGPKNDSDEVSFGNANSGLVEEVTLEPRKTRVTGPAVHG